MIKKVDTQEIRYALGLWKDTRDDSITREEAAQVVETFASHPLPVSVSADFMEGWDAAVETLAMALRFKEFHF